MNRLVEIFEVTILGRVGNSALRHMLSRNGFRVYAAWVCLMITTLSGPVAAELPYSPSQYVCYRTESPVVVDGDIDEVAWRTAPWTDWFVDIEGPSRLTPRFKTRVKMLWDDEYFYVAAEMEEPDLWATLTERDAVIFQDHDFEVFIDPDGDTHRYFEFEINALNTVWDLFLTRPYRDKPGVLNAWDIRGLKSAIGLAGTLNDPRDEDEGWRVELAFPWKVLQEGYHKKRAPESGEHYRVNFSRVQWRTETKNGAYQKVINSETGKRFREDNWVWSPTGKINMHMPERWGYVQFSDQVAGAGDESFVAPEGEQAKWALRQLYYRQKDLHREEGRFAASVAELGLAELEVDGYRWPPEIDRTWSFYEARLHGEDGQSIWHIAQDGRIWKTAE